MKHSKVKFEVSRPQDLEAAFSRVELLVTLATLALLVTIQLPALAHHKGNSHRAVCADNLHRLALSWLMYADDHHGILVPNGDRFPATANWVAGVLDFNPANSDNTNLATITEAELYPYNKAVEIYRCPDDLSAVRGQLRIRSYSMNGNVGDGGLGWSQGFQIMTDRSQVRQPDQTFVFVEQHPEDIHAWIFFVDMSPGSAASIVDVPAAYHYYGANLGFADGSVQYRRWLDPRTSPTQLISTTRSPNNPDVAWLQSVTTYRQ